MKHIIILIVGLLIYTNITANDCFIITFNTNYSSNYNSTNVFFIKGIKLKTVHHGIQIEVLEDLKQNLQEDTIMVWCSDGNSFRIANSEWYNNNDTLYMLITKTDLEGNDPGDLNDIPDDLEKPEDFMPIHCAYSILNNSNGYIIGRITSVERDTSILVTDFLNQLSTGFNLPDYERNIFINPNPVNTDLHITINKHIGLPVIIEIYDNTGQLLQAKKNGTKECVLNISSLKKGTYFLKIRDIDNNYLISKFMKL
jgi:hypothetical protein